MDQVIEVVAAASQTTSNEPVVNPETASHNQHVDQLGALREISHELRKAQSMASLHDAWIRLRYGFHSREKAQNSVQNTILVLSRRVLYHLQRVRALVEYVNVDRSLFYASLDIMDADLEIISKLYESLDVNKLIGLVTIADNLKLNIKSLLDHVEKRIGTEKQNVADISEPFDDSGVNYDSVEELPETDYCVVASLDFCFSMVEMIRVEVSTHGVKALEGYVDSCREAIRILNECLDNVDQEQSEYITDGIDHLNFFCKLLESEIIASDRSDISSLKTILYAINENLYEAVLLAHRVQAERIQSGDNIEFGRD